MSFSGLPGRGTLASWANGTTVAQSEFFWFESCIINALDGGAGGAYAPTSAIVLGGSGMQFAGPLVINATGSVSMTAGAGAFSCAKAATFEAASAVTMAAGAGAFVCNKTATLGGTTNLNGTTTVNGAIEFSGSSTVVSNCDEMVFNGGLTVNGAFQISAAVTHPISFGTNGYIQKRRASANYANAVISIQNYDIIHLYGSANGDLFVVDYGENGAVLRILNETSGTVTVKDSGDSASLYTVSTMTWLEIIRVGAGNHGWASNGRGTI